uniref:Uncharacterized protein n=1 Tax=Arundo donax TaxID=35708 RepID=A0A0A8ZMR0_ARUDO
MSQIIAGRPKTFLAIFLCWPCVTYKRKLYLCSLSV